MGTPFAAAPARVQKIRTDDIFFPSVALLLLAIVITGFGKSYFLAGMMLAKLPNLLVHFHGAVFITWIFLLTVQPWLIAAHRVKWHMKLGVLSLVLIPAMSVLGVLTLFDFIRRAQPDEGPELLLAGDLETLLLFVGLTTWGLLARRDAASHKRLMILGTMAIMGPAIARWDFEVPVTLSVLFALPLIMIAYDLFMLRRVHRTTVVGSALNAAVILTMLPLSKLAFWHQWVGWIRHT